MRFDDPSLMYTPYTHEDVDAIELERGKAYPRLRATVKALLAAQPPVNQCDGCKARRPFDSNGYHIMSPIGAPYTDLMTCQASKYMCGL